MLRRFRKIFVIPFGIAFLTAAVSLCPAQQLPEKQQSLSDRYAQLEQIILRMSEVSAATNPKRAELLRKVLAASKDRLVSPRLDEVVRTLEQKRLTDAISAQEGIEKDLLELLRLLESENRDQRREEEKERIKEFLRDLEELIHKERNLRQRTAQNEDTAPFEQEQRDVRLLTQSLRDRIDDHENPDRKRNDTDSQQKEEESQQGNENNSEKDLTPNASSPTPNETPTQQAMSQALQRMRQAEQKLREAEKKGALEDQEEAIAELQKAKAELEKILRQLREEELMQTLEKLEARFKRMLRVEQAIRSQTERLSMEDAADDEAKRSVQIQSSRLGADQQTVIEDADAALILLREDGTAQAMVESLLQARFDMEEARNRLNRVELGSVTLAIEDAVIAALEEMLEAIDLAMKEARQRQENQQGQSSESEGGVGEEPLIQLLSELKMIRSMQRRVNERTERYEKMLTEPNADLESLKRSVNELARQQNRISRILHDIRIGRTE